MWTRLPQGFCNSPNVFQSMVEQTFEGENIIIYIDYIYFSHDTESEHLECLDRVIKKLPQRGFKIGLKKCEIGVTECKYLGFQIGGIDDSDSDIDSPSENCEVRDSPNDNQITPEINYRPESLVSKSHPGRGSRTELRPRRSSESTMGLRMVCHLDGWKWGPPSEKRKK